MDDILVLFNVKVVDRMGLTVATMHLANLPKIIEIREPLAQGGRHRQFQRVLDQSPFVVYQERDNL